MTRDLRMGTFWHPLEESLCVFGAELLAEVGDDLTALLGTVMRRDGRNVGNVWTYEIADQPGTLNLTVDVTGHSTGGDPPRSGGA